MRGFQGLVKIQRPSVIALISWDLSNLLKSHNKRAGEGRRTISVPDTRYREALQKYGSDSEQAD